MAMANKKSQTAGKKVRPDKAEAKPVPKSQQPTVSGNADSDILLNQDQAAEFLAVKPSTLNTWRALRKGPKYSKVGRSVRYRKSDLMEFVEGGVVEPLVPVCQ